MLARRPVIRTVLITALFAVALIRSPEAAEEPKNEKLKPQQEQQIAWKQFRQGRINDAIETYERALLNAQDAREGSYTAQQMAWMCRAVSSVECMVRATSWMKRHHKKLPEGDQDTHGTSLYFWQYYANILNGNSEIIQDESHIRNFDSLDPVVGYFYYTEWKLLYAQILQSQGRHYDAQIATSLALSTALTSDSLTDNHWLASALSRIIGLLYEIGDNLKAWRILETTKEFISANLGNGPEFAIFIYYKGKLLVDRGRINEAIAHFSSAKVIYSKLQIDEKFKDFFLTEFQNFLILTLLDGGYYDEAAKQLSNHPLKKWRKEIKSRPNFEHLPHFIYAIMDVLVANVNNKEQDPDWEQLFRADLEWIPLEGTRAEFDIYRRYALAVLELERDKAQAQSMFRATARLALERFENRFTNLDNAFPLPTLIARAVLEVTLPLIGSTIDEDGSLFLRVSEHLNRNVKFSLADVLSNVAHQPDAARRKAAKISYRLARQQSEYELNVLRLKLGTPHVPVVRPPAKTILEVTKKYISGRERLRNEALQIRETARDRGFLPTLPEIQKILRPDEALVIHLISGFHIYKACIRRDRWLIANANIGRIASQIARDNKLVSLALTATRPPSDVLDSQYPVNAARRLFSLFFDGLETCITDGTHIIAASPIGEEAPLHALLKEAPATVEGRYDLSKARWLGVEHPISQLVSVRAFAASRKIAERSAGDLPFLGVGDPVLSTRIAENVSGGQFLARRSAPTLSGQLHDLPELPETGEELRAIGKLFKNPTLLLRDDATEERFRLQPLSRFNLINFATHGLVQGDISGLTEAALVMTPKANALDDPSNDGLLTARELANLQFGARIVVLSACNTANFSQKLFNNEVQGLTMAFALSGVPTVIASRWPVETDTNKRLITEFYSQLTSKDHPSAAESFRRAIQKTINDAPSRAFYHPRFWAAFAVMGDGSVTLNAARN